MKLQIDKTDWRIVELLQDYARMSFKELAEKVHLSSPAVADRVRRLEDAGIILGYHAALDPAELGYAIMAIIRVSVRSGQHCSEMLTLLEKVPEVTEAYRVTGTDSAFVTAFASSTGHLENLIDRISTIGQPTTSIVTSQFRRRPLFSEKQRRTYNTESLPS